MRLSVLGRRRGRAWAWLMVGLLIGAAAGAGAVYVLKRGKAGVQGGPRLGNASELAMVPADSAGFIHVRARDIWKLDHLDALRRAIDKAGPDALKALDEGFVPAPSTLDRMTIVFLKGDEAKPPQGEFAPPRGRDNILPPELGLPPVDLPSEIGGAVVILAFSAPFDAAKVRETYMPLGDRKTINGKEVWLDRPKDLGLYFPGDTLMVLGPVSGMEHFASKMTPDGKPSEGPLAASLKIAAEGGRHILAGINLKSFGPPNPNLFDRAPDDMKAIEKDVRTLLKAEALAIGFAFTEGGSKLDIRASYKNDDEAKSAETSARAVAAQLRKKLDEPKKQLQVMLDGKPGQKKPRPIRELPEAVLGLFGTGALNILDGHLENPPIKTEGNDLVATFDTGSIGEAYVGAAAVGVGLLMPAVSKVREAAGRMKGSNNLKQIGLAMYNYHDSNGRFPAQDGKQFGNEKGGLSWRVHLLPYVEEENLYRQFKFDEPWDSENNKKLIPLVPKVFVSPLATAPPGETYYQGFVGKGAFFEPGQRITLPGIPDGTSNTIMAIEGGKSVIWTKPDDIPFDGEKDIDPMSLALQGSSGINVLLADASVRYVNLGTITPQRLKAAITRNGGEIGGLDEPFPNAQLPMKGPIAPGKAVSPKNKD